VSHKINLLLQISFMGMLMLGLMLFAPTSHSAPITSAQVSPSLDVGPALQLSIPASEQGRFLTVYYAIASKPPIGLNDRQVSIVEIKSAITMPINSMLLQLPAVSFPSLGFRQGFNYVIFVFHAGSRYSWFNPDGSAPADPRGLTPMPNDFAAEKVIALTKFQIVDLATKQGHPDQAIIGF
jgi:hypothetical protein